MNLREFIAMEKTSVSGWARKIGIPQPVITRYLNGQRGLSSKTIAKIIAATGGVVTFEDLVRPGNNDAGEADSPL
jgi:plasmid maintenance system antidote protein VapI